MRIRLLSSATLSIVAGRTCSICKHEEIEAINLALISPAYSFRNVAQRFGFRDATSLFRHSKHLPADLVRAHEAENRAQADRLLQEVERLQGRAEKILDKAEADEDWRAATSAIREARACIETMVKVAAIIQDQRYKRSDVEWWSRQLVQRFQSQLADVAAGHRTPVEAMERVITEAGQLLAAEPGS